MSGFLRLNDSREKLRLRTIMLYGSSQGQGVSFCFDLPSLTPEEQHSLPEGKSTPVSSLFQALPESQFCIHLRDQQKLSGDSTSPSSSYGASSSQDNFLLQKSEHLFDKTSPLNS